MDNNPYAVLVNFLGFITGGILYGMLLVMVLKDRGDSRGTDSRLTGALRPRDRLPLFTAILGLAWNVVAFAVYGLPGTNISNSMPLLVAAAFTALGFLPAVVVHSVLRTGKRLFGIRGAGFITGMAYALSAVTSAMQFWSATRDGVMPSRTGLMCLTIGYIVLTPVLLLITRRDPSWRRFFWVVAMAVFSVSALHLSHHVGNDYPWWIELIGHHGSILLVLAILYQDYRFALADLFLKRALVLVLLVAIAFASYALVSRELPLIGSAASDPKSISVLLALWVGTALLYPVLRGAVAWFVDTMLLKRVNYDALRAEIARAVAVEETAPAILDTGCEILANALTARWIRWRHSGKPVDDIAPDESSTSSAAGGAWPGRYSFSDLDERLIALASDDESALRSGEAAIVNVPTVDRPQYSIHISGLAAGRRLMSDDTAMLESAALQMARAIDRVRVTHERCERDLREQQIGKLVTEAELRALRAQINPHFLFNTLTTIGYLIEAAPERALAALLRLTGLLRGTLQRSSGEFTTLGEEIELVEAYLEIEHARFENRLRITIDVPPLEQSVRIPSLLIQPLVENAVKHGIAPLKIGGEVTVRARIVSDHLHISVVDSGTGADQISVADGNRSGLGITNIIDRLRCHYGAAAALRINGTPGIGTEVEVTLPVTSIIRGASQKNGSTGAIR